MLLQLLVSLLLCNGIYGEETPYSPSLSSSTGTFVPRTTSATNRKPLLLILLDGFRHDYLNIIPGLVGFPRLQREGVRAQYMEPVYPSESYPGYYSIATGLFSESHGMVTNYMYDERRQEFFMMEPQYTAYRSHWWEESEPIWVTATRFGVNTGMFLWPGGATLIHSITAKKVKPYAFHLGVETFQEDLKSALNGLQEKELQFAMVYCEHVDKTGHKYGPESTELASAVRDVDSVLNYTLDYVEDLGLEDMLNIIIVSDHGMTATDFQSVKHIYLSLVVDMHSVEFVLDRGSHAGIYPKFGQENAVWKSLQGLEGVNVYQKENIPARFHFKNNDRVPPIYIVVKKGYFLHGLSDKQVPHEAVAAEWRGFHGYDPAEEDMWAIFLAKGPDFRENLLARPIHITDPYNLMMHLLGIPPQPNNGTWNNVRHMLRGQELQRQQVNGAQQNNFGVKLVWGIVAFYYTMIIMTKL